MRYREFSLTNFNFFFKAVTFLPLNPRRNTNIICDVAKIKEKNFLHEIKNHVATFPKM